VSGKGGKVFAGFVVLQVLCCSLPLLVGAGTFTGVGALLGSGTLVPAGLLAMLVAVAPERLPSRGRLLRCAAAAVRDGRGASVGPARRHGSRHDDRLDRPARNAVAARVNPADGDRPDPRPGRARSGRPMRVHAWSSTARRDDGGPHSVAMLPGVDAQTRARLDARLVGTPSCAR